MVLSTTVQLERSYPKSMDMTEVLSGRAGLVGVQRLLLEPPADEVLCSVLSTLLEEGAAIGAHTLQRAKYKPGRHLTTYYAVQVHTGDARSDSTRLIEVSWMPSGSADR